MARPLRPALAAALVAQNGRLPASPARDRNLARLAAGAGAVVTGQQVGLFLGPLYTIYKAATAVRAAAEAGAVPVFWLQTEDHDLAEIASCHIAPGAPPLALPSAGAPISVAHLTLPEAITARLGELGALLAGHLHAADTLARLGRHYRPGATWGQAFAGVLAELFAEEGLVMIDPRDPALAPLAAPVHEQALRQAAPLAAALLARARELGPRANVHVREGAPLSFYHPAGAEGPRRRLGPEDRLDDLLRALEADPRCFSTSALLRPILQDTLLPTLAYVGGPAEVAYFEQLPPLYAAFDLPMPRVLHRAHFRLIDEKTRRLLERLHLTASDAAASEDELLLRCRPPAGGELGAGLLAAFERGCAEAQVAPDLVRELDRARRAVARSLARLDARARRVALRRDGDLVEAVRRLRAILQPGGAPQERFYGLPYFGARFGDRSLVEKVLAAVVPGDATIRDLAP